MTLGAAKENSEEGYDAVLDCGISTLLESIPTEPNFAEPIYPTGSVYHSNNPDNTHLLSLPIQMSGRNIWYVNTQSKRIRKF